MEAWLSDVKQMRIPRPKFGSTTSPTRPSRIPREPPRDYCLSDDSQTSQSQSLKLQNETEELRQALQEKL